MRRMYFIGVTTGQSSIQRVFPTWARLAGLEDAELIGIDLPVGAAPGRFRAAVEAIRDDALAAGGLVTAHKINVYAHARDLFASFDPAAQELEEVSCIVRRGGSLNGQALDPLLGGLALRAIVPPPFTGQALIFGAGGAGLALSLHLARHHRPGRVVLTDVLSERLERAGRLTPAWCVQVRDKADNDRVLAAMPPGSLIVNATGMGKDVPGSPISPQAAFPEDAIAWDFNYRGELPFLELARARGVRTVDGWEYFLHGWSRIMARVFGFELTDGLFLAMRQAAEPLR